MCSATPSPSLPPSLGLDGGVEEQEQEQMDCEKRKANRGRHNGFCHWSFALLYLVGVHIVMDSSALMVCDMLVKKF